MRGILFLKRIAALYYQFTNLRVSSVVRNVAGMLALISTLFCWLGCRFRSRAELEFELIALRRQVAVLNRPRPGRLRLC